MKEIKVRRGRGGWRKKERRRDGGLERKREGEILKEEGKGVE